MASGIKIFALAVLLSTLVLSVQAQKGNNEIQIGAQKVVPIGDLATLTKASEGYSVKGLLGVGTARQQITIEINNNYFDIQEQFLVGGIDATYISWQFHAGYRRYIGKFFGEAQAGLALNTMYAFTTDSIINSAKQTRAYGACALGIGYKFKYLELGTRLQLSPVANSSDISFIAFRLALGLPLNKKR